MNRIVLKGTSVSSGVGIGEIIVLEQADFELNKGKIKPTQVESEIAKLETGLDKTLTEICDLKSSFANRLKHEENLILDVYKTILEDRQFIEEVKDIISSGRYYAEYAVSQCIDNYIRLIEDSDNEYALQNISDLNDIGARIIKNITGEDKTKKVIERIYHKQVIAVRQLTTSLAAVLGKKRVRGIIVEGSLGYLSHAAIILRGLGIPTISGIKQDNLKELNKENAVIDGNEGILVINPSRQETGRYRYILKSNIKKRKEFLQLFRKKNKVVTKDGYRITLNANINNIEECDVAVDNNLDGIGLVRTEILFANNKTVPDEKEQYLTYSRIAKKMKRKPVVIRTVDVGGDKFLECFGYEKGSDRQDLRGIGFSLRKKEQLKAQIRSILCAAETGNVSITFPMVSSAGELREVKKLIQKSKEELIGEGRRLTKEVKIGAFIETKEAVDNIDEILSEVDFINIGTNDLIQQIMGWDRKSTGGDKKEYLHPDFLRIIQYCINKAVQKNREVSICGEVASEPTAAVVLLGLGVRNLSMSPAKSENIGNFIRRINLKDVEELAGRITECSGLDEVKRLLFDWILRVQV